MFVRPKDGVCFAASKGDVLYMPTGAEYSIEFCNAKAGNIHSALCCILMRLMKQGMK